jgi:valyl-tRNA synthetase
MIHPFMPFISEYIYHNKYFNKKSIMLETLKKQKINNVCNEEAELFIDIYSNIKTLRIKNNIKNTKIININIVTTKNINIVKLNKYLNNFSIFINNISNIRNTEIKETIILKKYTFEILTAISSKKEEIIKNENLLRKLKLELERCIAILSNQDFIKKAPKEKVLLEENKQRDYQRQYEQVKAIIRELKKED